ncbi:hypothetical protein [Robertmurraya massiliosenegalensis]|uniref:hypothetical protein n=1 Tax=Robertmurraya massiliosenegalensis TaxID=1287657 RepID=UPI0002F964E6|nr:hypothetical protein [Robertmurraya massiliosenegalensis]
MNTPCRKFYQSMLSKGGKNAYIALLVLAAIERNEKELLKKANLSFIQSNLQDTNQQNQAS